MEMSRGGEDDPRSAARSVKSGVGVTTQRATGLEPARPNSPARSPKVATDNVVFDPPFVGARVAKGIALDDISSVSQLDRAVQEPVGIPAGAQTRNDDYKVQRTHQCRAPRRARQGEGERSAHPAGGLGILPRQLRR